jgi:NADH-quinone oxidoreductase subunit F
MGLCSKGPLVKRESDGALFLQVTGDDAPGLIDGVPSPSLETRRVSLETHPFFAGSPELRLLKRVGVVDPESLDAYRAAGGYAALERALEMGPEAVIAEVTAATRRGGAGYPPG